MAFEKMTDEALAFYIQEHNGQGIEELIERYQQPLLRYAERLINDPDIAQDAVQNTFLAAYQNINAYDARRPFSPWIYRIAHNKSVTEMRGRRFQSLDEAIEIPDDNDANYMSEKLDRKALRALIEKQLTKLNLKYRDPIILRFFEDKSYEEISDILRLPRNTVGVRVKRGLERLKINFNDRDKEYL